MSLALLWFRRDLRLADNPALHAASAGHDAVLPVFVWAPEEEAPWPPGAAARWWLHHSLTALVAQLAARGLPLVIRRGPTLSTLRALVRESGAQAVYWNRLYEPAVIERDAHVKSALRADGVAAESGNAALLVEPWELATAAGEPYRVFTPFFRALDQRLRRQLGEGRQPLPVPQRMAAPSQVPDGLPLAALGLLPKTRWDHGLAEHWRPGESGAQTRLAEFLDEAVVHYRERRDFPALAATSRLSPHLHFGEISPLAVAAAVERKLAVEGTPDLRRNAEWFVRELDWREFAHHLLYHFPRTPLEPLHERFADFPWRAPADYAADLAAWQRGATGVPIVDAGMRELWHTGWMHNRVRMIVASFLTKNLLIPWQEGARWFWDTLVDADLANNTLGWQWSAGCGADAAPYFRIFNPVLQAQKFDGSGDYLRRWLPELRGLPAAAVHAPWETGGPPPIVDLRGSRQRALAAYERLRRDSR